MHRTVAADERELMGGAMNLDATQQRIITSLKVGWAAAYAEGADRPYLVRVKPAKGASSRSARRPSDNEIRAHMTALKTFAEPIYQPRPGCEQCRLWLTDSPRCAMTRDRALILLDRSDFAEAYRRYTSSLAVEPAQVVNSFPEISLLIKQVAPIVDEQHQRDLTLCTIVHAATGYIDRLGRYYQISYDTLEALHQNLLLVTAPVAKGFRSDQPTIAALLKNIAPLARRYGDQLRGLISRPHGPFAGCVFCKHRCHYGADIAPLAHDPVLQRDVLSAIQTAEDQDAMLTQLVDTAREAASRTYAASRQGRGWAV